MIDKNGIPKFATVIVEIIVILAFGAFLNHTSSGNSQGKGEAVVKQPVAAAAASSPSSIKLITPNDYASELDKANNVLIQLCKTEECTANRAVLERLQAEFADVKFVQMNSADNAEFADRLEREQEQVAKADKSQSALVYPVYVFKSADLQVAPPLKTDDELKQFIATNLSAGAPEIAK